MQQDTPSDKKSPIRWLKNLQECNSVTLTDWLNQQIQSSSAAAVADTLRNILIQLAATREQTLSSIESVITGTVSTIPKLLLELVIIKEAARSLQNQILAASPTTKPKEQVDQALARISALSLISQSMISARNTLREAQAWSTLETQVQSCLSEKRWDEVVDRIVKAGQSLSVFKQGSSSSEERQALLERLTDKFQEQLSSITQTAIKSRDNDTTIRMATLYNKIGRLQAGFCETYFATRREEVCKKWSEHSQSPLALSLLFGDTLALLVEERMFASSIFGDRSEAAKLLLGSVFGSLQPCLFEYLQTCSSQASIDEQLASLTKSFQATQEAFKALQEMLPAATSHETTPVQVLDPKMIPGLANLRPWSHTLFEAFLDWQVNLAALEERAMLQRWHASTSDFNLGSDKAKDLKALVKLAVDTALVSTQRSKVFTRGYASAGLIEPIEKLVSGTVGRLKEQHEAASAVIVERVIKRGDDGLSTADWEDFKRGTELLAASRDAIATLTTLEKSIAEQLVEVGLLLPPCTGEQLDKDRPIADAFDALETTSLNSSSLRQSIQSAKEYLSQAPIQMLPQSSTLLFNLAQSVQRFLHDLVLAPFMPELESYASLPVWNASIRPGSTNEYDLAMPKFSLSPTDLISRIGEGLLNLPRLFEAYAEEALTFALPPQQQRGEEDHLSRWLQSLTETFLDHLQAVLSSIHQLSNVGAAQLSVDLEYLANILTALNSVTAEEELRTWCDAAALNDQVGIKLARGDTDDDSLRTLSNTKGFERIATLRRWRM